MKIDIQEQDDSIVYKTTQKMFTKVVDTQQKETLKAILKYCKENNIIPNLIDKEKLDLVLRLGINELNRRNLTENDKKQVKWLKEEFNVGVEKE